MMAMIHWTHEGGPSYRRRVSLAERQPPVGYAAMNAASGGLRVGEPGFRRLSIAMFAGGVATFALFYAPQPVLPQLGAALHAGPAAASLAISATTAALAVVLLLTGRLAARIGRRRLMIWSMATAAVVAAAVAAAPNLPVLVGMRALEGVVLAGVPAVAVTHIHAEVHPESAGYANGLYVAGTAFGGMLGRLLSAAVTDLAGWRLGMLSVAVLSAAAAVAFVRCLPPATAPARPAASPPRLRARLTDPRLLALYLVGGLLMLCYVAVSNGLAYRLIEAPYHLSPTLVGFTFAINLVGMVTSTWSGRLADRWGRQRVLPAAIGLIVGGLLLTAAGPLPLLIAGVVLLTGGFFAGHSLAIGWTEARASGATACYLVAYYAGSAVAGPAGGLAWSGAGWTGLLVGGLGCLLVALGLSGWLARRPNGGPRTL